MARKSKAPLPTCDACGRLQNDYKVLMTMYGRGPGEIMHVCGAAGCTDKANERGYYSSSQERPDPS